MAAVGVDGPQCEELERILTSSGGWAEWPVRSRVMRNLTSERGWNWGAGAERADKDNENGGLNNESKGIWKILVISTCTPCLKQYWEEYYCWKRRHLPWWNGWDVNTVGACEEASLCITLQWLSNRFFLSCEKNKKKFSLETIIIGAPEYNYNQWKDCR